MAARKKIVMVCDAVTLAHPLRAQTLLNTLSPEEYEVVFYCADTYRAYMPTSRHAVKPIGSIAPQEFNRRVQQGQPIHTPDLVERYLGEELRILREEKPDLVIGDFRLTLQVSARMRKVPYLTLIDAHWSPHTGLPYRLADIPLARLLPLSWLDGMLNTAPAVFFAPHMRAINRARVQVGLAPHRDIRPLYADAEYVAYPTLPMLLEGMAYPANHSFIGHVDPPFSVDPPVWWGDVPDDKPIIYVNLGSSGTLSRLPALVQQLARTTDATLMVASGTQALADAMPPGVFAAPVIANAQAIPRAALMIGNGGVLSTMSAALSGCYYLGLCSNMDQVMNMSVVEKHGLGKCYRQPRRDINALVAHAVSLPRVDAVIVQNLQSQSAEYDPAARFNALVRKILS